MPILPKEFSAERWVKLNRFISISSMGRVRSNDPKSRGHYLQPRVLGNEIVVFVKDPENPQFRRIIEVEGAFNYFFGIHLMDNTSPVKISKGRNPRPVRRVSTGDEYFSAREAAREVGKSESWIYRRISVGDDWEYIQDY